MVSKLILMLPQDETAAKRLAQWQSLEKQMEAEYQNEMRRLQELEQLESEEEGYRELLVETTGAKLTLQSSVSHVYNFCSRLPSVSYTKLEPIFTYTDSGTIMIPSISCRVELPNCLDASVRVWNSRDRWASEKNARTDAAFEAYVGLRAAGLINDNLLAEPQLDPEAERAYSDVIQRPSMVQVDSQMDSGGEIAGEWTGVTRLWITDVSIVMNGIEATRLEMVTPCRLPLLPALALFVDHEVTMEIIFRHPVAMTADESDIKSAKASTHILLHSMFRTRMHTDRRDFPVLFRPSTKGNRDDWHTSTSGEYPATNLSPSTPFHEVGIVRSRLGLFVYHGREMHTAHELEEEGSNEATSHLKCWPFPKRLDLLHPLVGSSPQNNTFVPVQFTSKENLLSAMTASSAREGNNYQRLEFLGDAILKYVTALTLMAHHPQWHEGYLSRMKDHIVSNGSLALAAQTTGLVRYIATRQFTAHKWRPMYNDDLLADHAVTKRELSSKVMADVIEAIIGAAYVDGGLPKALAILGIFLPQMKWQPLKELTATLQQAALPAGPLVGASSPQIVRLEQLLVHTFDDKALLLEAITHGSCTMSKVPSYQRLEYLGDAVLDYIVTNIIFNHHKQPPVYLMHRLRTATVNAGFLAFRALSTTTPISTAQIDTFMPSADTSSPAFKQTISKPSLLDFLQKAHIPNLNAALNDTRSRYNLLQPLLALALDEGDTYHGASSQPSIPTKSFPTSSNPSSAPSSSTAAVTLPRWKRWRGR
jgi:dsRNA-specific ribonuclease